MNIEWEFELAREAKQNYRKSMTLVPRFATTTKNEKEEIPLLGAIKIKKSDAGPFQPGDRVKLKASIDDFS